MKRYTKSLLLGTPQSRGSRTQGHQRPGAAAFESVLPYEYLPRTFPYSSRSYVDTIADRSLARHDRERSILKGDRRNADKASADYVLVWH